jgi:hypothetical protein
MATKTGWWSVKFELTVEGEEVIWRDLSDVTREHIIQCLLDDCYQGEIVEEDDESDEPNPDDSDDCSHCANNCDDEEVCENCEYKSE